MMVLVLVCILVPPWQEGFRDWNLQGHYYCTKISGIQRITIAELPCKWQMRGADAKSLVPVKIGSLTDPVESRLLVRPNSLSHPWSLQPPAPSSVSRKPAGSPLKPTPKMLRGEPHVYCPMLGCLNFVPLSFASTDRGESLCIPVSILRLVFIFTVFSSCYGTLAYSICFPINMHMGSRGPRSYKHTVHGFKHW